MPIWNLTKSEWKKDLRANTFPAISGMTTGNWKYAPICDLKV